MNNVYLSLGSNIGNREKNIISALFFLQSSGCIIIKKISSFYETSPIGPRQNEFYNIAINVLTNICSIDLLILIKHIENILGRKKTMKWGPRVIDIDILFFGNEIIAIDTIPGTKFNLFIPHMELQNRLFVLIPLSEIIHNFIHPILNVDISDILKTKLLTQNQQKIKKLC
ncbi:MAG: 2-amino-4-hydroxy-6-hydroxymethyldihydropteridine diphosphokinase [Endomicrobium sp.]|jgi:2-amino-4-hydroxy-6-hydroxymethyldihydropteridine diphosphokinase|nr:2-amino-4-hydroxy-6-hydroxymethyldihydropteridine diphosphokinase [Endomicrobium sp.]